MTHIDPPPGYDRYGAKGLLDTIADTALDDDYYEIRRDADKHGLGTFATATAVMIFALMVTVAAVQTRTDRPLDQLERDALISDIGSRKQNLEQRRAKSAKLQSQIAALQQSSTATDPKAVAARLATAVTGATGAGIRIIVLGRNSADSNGRGSTAGQAVDEVDLMRLVNRLWYAGAEAIAINDNRLSALSAISRSGQSITVNYRSLTQPYVIAAIGDANRLAERINDNATGTDWTNRAESTDLRLKLQQVNELTLPAAPVRRTDIRHASQIKGES